MSKQPDYDSPWKDIMDCFFIDFLSFFFPDVHAGIDWKKGCTFLDKEFQKLVRDSELGRRLADKLVKLHTSDGKPVMVLVHVEIQGRHETNFAERMYVYNYRIYDKYRYPVVSLAVLTDESTTWKPSKFKFSRWGFALKMKFPIVKLLDYNDFDALNSNPNPFAIVAMAHLKTLETRHNNQKRYEWKWHVTLKLYKRGYTKQDVIGLFLFIDWIMYLPAELKKKFSQRMIDYEEAKKMKFISGVEELIRKKEMEKGMLTEAREMVAEALAVKFSSVPEKILSRLFSIEDRSLLKQLLKKVILSDTIEQFDSEFQLT